MVRVFAVLFPESLCFFPGATFSQSGCWVQSICFSTYRCSPVDLRVPNFLTKPFREMVFSSDWLQLWPSIPVAPSSPLPAFLVPHPSLPSAEIVVDCCLNAPPSTSHHVDICMDVHYVDITAQKKVYVYIAYIYTVYTYIMYLWHCIDSKSYIYIINIYIHIMPNIWSEDMLCYASSVALHFAVASDPIQYNTIRYNKIYKYTYNYKYSYTYEYSYNYKYRYHCKYNCNYKYSYNCNYN